MIKLPEEARAQVTARIAAALTGEVEGIAKFIYELAYARGAKDLKARVVKHCDERGAWLEAQRAARPTEGWDVRKNEVEHLTLELRSFTEEPQG